MRETKLMYSGAAAAALAVALASSPVLAQNTSGQDAGVQDTGAVLTQATTPEPSDDQIVVTGSRIRRDPLSQTSPVITVDESAIQRTGLTSIADVLQRLPSASGGLNTKVNNSGNLGNPPDGGGVGAGASEIDLRYLSAKRTLVLVDGLRYVNGTSGSGIPSTVDLNTIPASMIDRIEVLQAGASPLYGSDAIAGVVNVITKQRQEGLRLSGQFGTFRAGDGHTYNIDASYGFQSETSGTSLVFGASYVNQKAVRSSDRRISQFPNPGQTACTDPVGGCSSAAVNGRFLTAFGNQTISGPPDATPTLAELRPFTAADRFNFAPFNYLLTPSERYGAWVSFRQDLGGETHLRIKASYNRRNSQNQAAFEPLFIGPDAGNGAGSLFDTLSIDRTNPFDPYGVTLESGVNPDGTPNGRAANYSFVARRLVEAGQRTFNQRVDTFSATATLDGSFELGTRKFYWDANAALGINDAHQSFTGNVRADLVALAIGPVANCTGSCVPLNLFGGAGSITPEMLNYVGFTERDKSDQHLYDYTLNVSGEIFDLPGGPVAIAVGYEHRLQSAIFTPDPIVAAGLGADIPAQPASGQYNSDEVYGEIRVPLLKDVPFFSSLEVDGAMRHANYSLSGSATTYTGTGLWKPIEDLLIRGSYTTGFRAPSLGELFGGRSRFDLPVTDPCSSASTGQFQTNATVRANCIADGVPANGSYAEEPGQLPVLTQGNRDLDPEKSRNITAGIVYSPKWARSGSFASVFNIEANYYDIRVRKAIAAFDPNVTLNSCAQNGDAASCALIVRTANGFINEINGTLQNLDSIRTRGIDLTANYRTPETSIGSFGLSFNATRLLKYVLSASNGFVVLDRKGTERGSPDQAFPKYKGNATIDWQSGWLGASFTGRYIDGVVESGADNRLKSRLYGDVQLRITPLIMGKRFGIAAGVNNVFNSDPPACVTCSLNNFDPTTYDVPGQFGYLKLTFGL